MRHTFIENIDTGPVGPVTEIGTPTADNKVGISNTQSFDHSRTGSVVNKSAMRVSISSVDMVNSVTYGGQPLVLAREDGFGVSGTSIWIGLNGLPTGINTVFITYASAIGNAYAHVKDLDNVNQTTPTGDAAGSASSSDTVSNSVTILQDSLADDVATNDFYSLGNVGPIEQITAYSGQGSGDMEAYGSFNSDQNAGIKLFTWSGGFASPISQTVVEYLND